MRLPALALLAATVLAAAPIPAPVVVDEPGGTPPGRSLSPGVARVEAPPDGVLVTHRLTVGDGGHTVFALSAREVVRGPDGAPELGGPSDGLRLPAGTVALDPGERATVTSVAEGATSGSRLLALTATPDDGGGALVGLVIAAAPGTAPPGPPEVTATVEPAPDGARRLVVTLPPTGDAHDVTDVRVRLSPPVGPAILDETLRDVVLWPDEARRLTWQVELTPWPLPHSLEVAAGTPGGEVARAATTVWPPLGAWLPLAAVLLLLVALLALVVVRRGAARRGPDGQAPDDGA